MLHSLLTAAYRRTGSALAVIQMYPKCSQAEALGFLMDSLGGAEDDSEFPSQVESFYETLGSKEVYSTNAVFTWMGF